MGWGLIWGGWRCLCFVLLNIDPCVVSPAQKSAPPPVSFSWEEGGGRWVAEELADGMCSRR